MHEITNCNNNYFDKIYCNFREVVLGDYVLDPNSDPDCTKNACAPKRIVKKIAKIIKHEQFSRKSNGKYQNDIALIRLQEPIPLHNEVHISKIKKEQNWKTRLHVLSIQLCRIKTAPKAFLSSCC